jgi:cytochrome b pre-mRNA-processing protein 3
MFRRLFARARANEAIAYSLYGAIVAQGRQPVLYATFGVSDTIDGRFDMLVLHAFLLFHRLQRESAGDRQIVQDVFNIFLKDMDQSLREIGVGDISVPKKLKKMTEMFYGRVRAYDIALQADRAALIDAITRNVYPAGDPAGHAAEIATYVMGAVDSLSTQSRDAILSGTLTFPAIQLNEAA